MPRCREKHRDDTQVTVPHNRHRWVGREYQGGVTQTKGKCSVSIVHVKSEAALGHTGINVHAGKKAPAFAFSTELSDIEIRNFMGDVINMFYQMNDDTFLASTKIISH